MAYYTQFPKVGPYYLDHLLDGRGDLCVTLESPLEFLTLCFFRLLTESQSQTTTTMTTTMTTTTTPSTQLLCENDVMMLVLNVMTKVVALYPMPPLDWLNPLLRLSASWSLALRQALVLWTQTLLRHSAANVSVFLSAGDENVTSVLTLVCETVNLAITDTPCTEPHEQEVALKVSLLPQVPDVGLQLTTSTVSPPKSLSQAHHHLDLAPSSSPLQRMSDSEDESDSDQSESSHSQSSQDDHRKNITSPSPSDSNVSIDGSTSHLLSNTHVVIPTRALSCPMGFCEMALGLLHQLVKCHANNTSASCLNNHHPQPQSSLAPVSSSLQVLIRPSVWVLVISFLGLEAQLEPSTPHFYPFPMLPVTPI